MAEKLDILFLTARFPFPIVGGDRLKPFHIISYLAAKYNVTLVSFYQASKPPESYIKSIEALGVKLYVVPLNPLKSGINALTRLFRYPLEISYYTRKDFFRVVNKLFDENEFDLAFAFFMRTAEYLKNRKIKKILLAEDCRTLYQKRSYETSTNLIQKSVRYWEYIRLKEYEPRIVDSFDVTTLVTHDDIKAMAEQNPNPKYMLLTNGTDINTFTPPENKKREGILFAGKLDVWANQLMIKKIINEILPEIHKILPDTELKIVGANPPSSVLALQSDKIKVIPDVPEMLPYLQSAELFLHPHNGGSGIQNKLLEAMACGCPVVTTATGNQGINARHGEEVLLGSSSAELAENAVKILKDSSFAELLSKNARELIVNTHSWDVVFNDLDRIIDEVINK
ncbi:glycosyltransferase [Bacteroidota bacterium]